MAITNHEIDSYKIYHYNAENSYGQIAVINCYKNGSFKGSLYFYKDGETVPASKITSSGYLYLRFNEGSLQSMIETLRQEKPLYIGFNDSNSWGWLSTSTEPIGEEEA